jgi:hypothetical protein
MLGEGIGGLYKGVSSPVAGQMLFRANMFLSFAVLELEIALFPLMLLIVSFFY